MTKASNEEFQGSGNSNVTRPSADDGGQPKPDTAPPADSARNDESPVVKLGRGAKAAEKLAEAAGPDNPVHHTGRVPPPVTSGDD